MADGPSQAVPRQRFNMLRREHSNRCALRPRDVNALASSRRLQGSCCTPMMYRHYAEQTRGLSAYRSVPQIPRDPYDISVTQAKQLLVYDRSIWLARVQRAAYRHAMRLAHEHGPCCCHCWRWSVRGTGEVPNDATRLERSGHRQDLGSRGRLRQLVRGRRKPAGAEGRSSRCWRLGRRCGKVRISSGRSSPSV